MAVATERHRNGLLKLLIGLALVSAAGVAAMALNNSRELHAHEMSFGHIGMEERVANIEEDVAEIRDDVKELLRRNKP